MIKEFIATAAVGIGLMIPGLSLDSPSTSLAQQKSQQTLVADSATYDRLDETGQENLHTSRMIAQDMVDQDTMNYILERSHSSR